MLQGASNDRLYTRNGIFKLNAENQMIAITGQRLLGFGVNSDFEIDESTLKPVEIPLGSTAVAQATKNVFLQGQLSPTGALADTAEQIQTAVLGNAYYTAPEWNATAALAIPPNTAGAHTAGASQAGGSMTAGQTYEYRLAYATEAYAPPLPMPPLSEGAASEAVTATVAAGDGSILLSDLPWTLFRPATRTCGSTAGWPTRATATITWARSRWAPRPSSIPCPTPAPRPTRPWTKPRSAASTSTT